MQRTIVAGAVVFFAVAATGLAVASPGDTSRAQSAGASTMPTTPGTHQLTLPDGRRYTLVIPEGYTGTEPVPLVMSLHYGGNVTPFYGRGLVDTLIGPALGELGAIVVAPDNVTRGWANPEGEAHVVALLDHVGAHYRIDPARTLLTGYSMGGMGTWYLAPRLADRFTAAIPMAGRPQDDSTTREWPIPMYVIHSTADEVVAIGPTRTAVAQLKSHGAPIELVVVDGITHFEMARFQPHLKAALPWIRRTWK